MLLTLLRAGGECPVTEIAESILARDQSQIEYYEGVTKGMVGKVLARHGVVERRGGSYRLVGFEDLSDGQVFSLISLCQEKLDAYQARRGERIWQHRKKSSGYVSGTLKYEVLKRAKFRCELCGISAELKALEVDHIIPRNHGGSDDPDNLQALCYSCNAMKRDRDSTDFRAVRAAYDERDADCAFCEIPAERVVDETELAYAVRDLFPVTDLHTLIIPKRHAASYFELGRPEVNACNTLLAKAKLRIGETDAAVTGFNIGINDGESAGQSVFHCHIHLIPRRRGDVESPRGGVRHVIPGRGDY